MEEEPQPVPSLPPVVVDHQRLLVTFSFNFQYNNNMQLGNLLVQSALNHFSLLILQKKNLAGTDGLNV